MSRLRHQLVTDGLALFGGVDGPDRLLSVATTLMTVWPHPDASPDGVTVLNDRGVAGEQPGSAGFSHRALSAHTDRSSVAAPPALLMVTCAESDCVGGSSGFIDGRSIREDLASSAPETLKAFERPESVRFGGPGGHLGAVFTEKSLSPDVPPRLHLRLRLDELVTFAPDLSDHLPVLMAAIERHTLTVTLTPGRGYLLDNHRWMHSRTAYTGARTLYRVLGVPLPDLGLRPGIPLGPLTRSSVGPVRPGSLL